MMARPRITPHIGFLLGLLVLSPLLSACGETRPSGPQVETARLDNGLEIIVIPDFRADVVTHMLWYKTGSADEPKGKSGIAHFFEHLMFRGTENIAPGEFSKTVARLGGQDNAFTSYDFTAYFQRIHRDKLGTMMRMEAERMRTLIINPEIVAVERGVILEERSMRVDGNPSALLNEKMRARLHKGTPYSVPVIGWREEIAALNAADAQAFYDRYYAPDNAVLVVAGAVTLAEVVALAETHYGGLKPAARPRDTLVAATDLRVEGNDKIEVLRDARVRQAAWRRFYRLPQYHEDDKHLFAAADILGEVLGAGTGRLYKALVVEQGLAVSAAAYSDSARLLNGEFAIYVSPRPGVDFAVLEQAIEAELARLRQEDISQEELARAKLQTVSGLIFARDSQQSMAQIFGQAAARDIGPREVLDWPRAIEAVTPADVRAAAALFLNNTHSLTGHLLGAIKEEAR